MRGKASGITAEAPERRVVIVGHVDHGKSTLIGRLLYDTGSLPRAVREEVESVARSRGGDPEFAFLLDHLREEREQSITIDTAQAHFDSDGRHFVIIDAPGHQEFLKNMVTGATQASAALLMVDVQDGVREQTRRHAHMLALVGISELVVAVNKLDAVEFRREPFAAVQQELGRFLARLRLSPRWVVPVSAKHGDNVARRSARIGWHDGPCLLEALHRLSDPRGRGTRVLRLPVQDVYDIRGRRIYVGRLESGTLRTGEAVVVFPGGRADTVRTIEVFLAERSAALAGEAIGVTLAGGEGVERGSVIARVEAPPTVTHSVRARIFSLSKSDLRLRQRLTLKLATQEVPATLAQIGRRVDSATLEADERPGTSIRDTEVADVVIQTERPVVVDPYAEIPEMGRFVLDDGQEPVAGGLVSGVSAPRVASAGDA